MNSPAEQAADNAWSEVQKCLDQNQSFLLEAGAGAGKTHSLIRSLKYLISSDGMALTKNHQRIACITYTNVATEEIESRTDRHPLVFASTIHAFCWSLIKYYQPLLRKHLLEIEGWAERVKDVSGVECRKIEYSLGHPKVEEEQLSLGHNDVLKLTCIALANKKFCRVLKSRFPYVLIDEYQDTDADLIEAIKTYVLGSENSSLVGFFGDHWQKIYGSGCGTISHPKLTIIGKGANFRSVATIVDSLNQMRPELKQHVKDPDSKGTIQIFHTNLWRGKRRTGAHWNDDLPADVGHKYLQDITQQLETTGWDFFPKTSKVLMLTHNILAAEQGYHDIADIFKGRNDTFIKKEDPHISFLLNTFEPACEAYEGKRYAEMFAYWASVAPGIRTFTDKGIWSEHMSCLMHRRESDSIGSILRYLRQIQHLCLPDEVLRREKYVAEHSEPTDEDEDCIVRLRRLHQVPYSQVKTLGKYIEEKTPFSTKHGVKGAEFENVLAVFGRGWNTYNFNNFLEQAGEKTITAENLDSYERNRNLFYVVCSRPKARLCLLFTQRLSERALRTLGSWFGHESIHQLPP